MEKTIETIFKSINCMGLLIADGQGKIIQVEDDFNEIYGVKKDELLGRSVYELEEIGVFRPSAVASVLRTGEKITLIQKIKNNKKFVVTAFPVIDDQGKILKVITFSRDISEYTEFSKLYKELMQKIDLYENNLLDMEYDSTIIEGFYTKCGSFQKSLRSLQRVAKYDINILIQGETGVGKTLIAKKIHKMSDNKNGRFIEINCGAIPENLIESELFGYEKGAFTGARNEGKSGLLEAADGGALFLDEICEMPQDAQVKLLKVLEEKQYFRIGGTKTIKSNCHIIAASNKNIDELALDGSFRKDLLYRLNSFVLIIPPLRERKEDIPYLADVMLKKANEKYDVNKILDTSVLKAFMKYDWPGNVRELENTISRMALTSEADIITIYELPEHINNFIKATTLDNEKSPRVFKEFDDLTEELERYEGSIIRDFYEREKSSTRVAQALNISQTTAARKIRKYCSASQY